MIQELEGYRAEQIEILKERENKDKAFLEEMLQSVGKYQKKVNTLTQRVKKAKEQLENNNE